MRDPGKLLATENSTMWTPCRHKLSFTQGALLSSTRETIHGMMISIVHCLSPFCPLFDLFYKQTLGRYSRTKPTKAGKPRTLSDMDYLEAVLEYMNNNACCGCQLYQLLELGLWLGNNSEVQGLRLSNTQKKSMWWQSSLAMKVLCSKLSSTMQRVSQV